MHFGTPSCPKSTQVRPDAYLIKWAEQEHFWDLEHTWQEACRIRTVLEWQSMAFLNSVRTQVPRSTHIIILENQLLALGFHYGIILKDY